MMSMLIRLLMHGAHHPHGPHLMCPLATEAWRCRFCLLLGFEHRLLRLITVGVGDG